MAARRDLRSMYLELLAVLCLFHLAMMYTDPPDQPAHPTMTYKVTNGANACIIFRAGLQLTIPYEMDAQSTSKIFNVPNTTFVDTQASSCGLNNDPTTQTLKLNFFKGWSILVIFTESGGAFTWTSVSVTYVIDEEHFPDFKNGTGGNGEVGANVDHLFKSAVGGSYICDSGSTVNLYNGLVLEVFDLQYKAFANSSDGSFSSDDVAECSADSKTDSIVLPAVGAGLAALVVIVVIAYLIGRKRNRKGYESV